MNPIFIFSTPQCSEILKQGIDFTLSIQNVYNIETIQMYQYSDGESF